MFQYCPVCSLLCSCSKCRRKLETVAREFKRECENQGAKLQDTKCHDILERCEKAVNGRGVTVVRRIREEKDEEGEEPSPPMPEKVSKPRKSVGSRPQQRQVRMVPKPPLSAFPREVCGLAEIEPGTPGDYLTVYTSNGSYLVDGFPEAWKQQDRVVEKAGPLPASDGEPSEDGNVDFCQICITPGNLVCCDFCPRAFHPDCIKSGDQSTSDEHWECFVCKKERAGLEGDVVDGNKSFDLISASFLDVDASDEKSLNGMRVLSMIHEMLGKLMEYDFGYMFMKPVDCEAVPGYKDIVKHPMDLGTICSKLINGGYSNILKENNSFDDVIVEVLKAVELVWHNCYIFNFGGSAIYRMAVVQSRRAKAICERSFNNLLSDEVKVALQDYHRACELERGQSSSQNHFSASPEEKALRAQRPKSKHKITIQSFNPSVSRPVAILDPVSGRMVKIFSTLKTAAQAAQMLLELGHPCEYDLGHDVNMKSIAKRSAADPSILLFGYRWLMLHALRTGKVKFLRPSADFVEMHHNSCTYAFLSIDEAVSFPDLPKKTKLDELRERLAAASRGLEWIEISGRKWRRPEIPKEAKDPERKNVKESKKNGSSSLLGSTSQSRSPYLEHETYFLKNSAVVKEDLVTCRKLIGYENVPAAYEDWMLTIVSSPTFPESEARSMENFQKYYLDGDRNIDGIVWRSLKAVAPCSNEKQETKQEVCLGNRQTGDISAPKDSAADVSTEQQAKEAAPGSEAISDVKDSSIKVTVSGNGSNTMQVDTSDDLVDKLGADSPSALGKRKRLDVEVPLEESAEQLSVSADKNSKKLNLGEQNQKVGKDALVVTGNPTPEPLCERQAPS